MAEQEGGAQNPVALVIGPPQSGKRSIASGVVGLKSSAGTPVSPRPHVVGGHVYELGIDNKYYTAQVDVHVLPADWFRDRHPGISDAVSGGCEALIVVVDSTQPSSIADVRSWAEVFGNSTASTMLLVGTRLDIREGASDRAGTSTLSLAPGGGGGGGGGGGDPAIPSAGEAAGSAPPVDSDFSRQLEEWCFDNGFEYVDCNALDPSATADAREKLGIARVLEALESTMWSQMTYKARSRPTLGSAVLERPSGSFGGGGLLSGGLGGGLFDGGHLSGGLGSGLSGSGVSAETATERSDEGADGMGVSESKTQGGAESTLQEASSSTAAGSGKAFTAFLSVSAPVSGSTEPSTPSSPSDPATVSPTDGSAPESAKPSSRALGDEPPPSAGAPEPLGKEPDAEEIVSGAAVEVGVARPTEPAAGRVSPSESALGSLLASGTPHGDVAAFEEMESDLASFESLMQRVAAARANAGSVSDAQRRATAEHLAMLMHSMMGFGDDDGDGDGDDDDDDDGDDHEGRQEDGEDGEDGEGGKGEDKGSVGDEPAVKGHTTQDADGNSEPAL